MITYRLAANVEGATDPRATNARAFVVDATGKVVGMELRWQSRPETAWELVQAVLIDEYQAMGNTVATYSAINEQGLETPVNCYPYWPDAEPGANRALPGNPNRQHTITSKFPADGRVGPLGLYIGKDNGVIDSDTLYGLGLPDGHHVCFLMAWRKRGSTPGGGGEPVPSGDNSEIVTALREIRDVLKTGLRV